MRHYLLTTLLTGWSVARAAAQQLPPDTAFPRFYAGASCLVGVYEVFYPVRAYDEGGLVPVMGGGYQLSPRTSIQAAVGAGHQRYYNELTQQTAGGQTVRATYFQDDHWLTAVPVLLRLTGTRRLQRRVQFDALAGFTLLHGAYDQTFDQYDNQQVPVLHEEHTERVTNVAFTGGVSARYRFGRHVEGVGDAVLNRTVTSNPLASARATYSVGLRYCFGHR